MAASEESAVHGRICILGAGPAGLGLALGIARRGFSGGVVVYDQAVEGSSSGLSDASGRQGWDCKGLWAFCGDDPESSVARQKTMRRPRGTILTEATPSTSRATGHAHWTTWEWCIASTSS